MWAINSILEIFFPERKQHKIIREASISDIQKFYLPQTNEDWIALASFQEPMIRAAIHETKFHQNEKAIELLGQLLNLYLSTLKEPAVLIPTPLSRIRHKERGYNQVTEVAKAALKNHTAIILNERVLIKTINTKPQTSLDKTSRLQNVAGAYALEPKLAKEIVGQNIILLDDVVTTGATLKEARAVLLAQHPASIICVALAH